MKKLLLSFSGYAFALGFALWSGCKDDCPPCGDNYKKIPETTKEWINFGIGSTWIYRLAEDTTVFDTLTLMGVDERASNIFCRSEFAPAVGCSEVLIFIFKHSNAKYFPRYGSDTLNASFNNVFVYTPHGGGEFLSLDPYGVFLGFPIRLNEKYDFLTLIDTFSNFKLLNNVYNDVIHSSQPLLPKYEKLSDIWWAKQIGLIKTIQIGGIKPKITWELINHNIKK